MHVQVYEVQIYGGTTGHLYRMHPQTHKENLIMSADIPNYIVHLTASCLKSYNGAHPNQRVSFPVTGILFERDRRRCVVSATVKRFDTDAISVTGITGMDGTFSTYRKKLSYLFSVPLAPVSMARSYECEEQGCGLLVLHSELRRSVDRHGTLHCNNNFWRKCTSRHFTLRTSINEQSYNRRLHVVY
jgi:hypothetical protein